VATRHSLGLAATLIVLGSAGHARAQPVTDLESARALFKEAVSDEDDFRRFDSALAKFRRVQGYKDSVNVRYRIGTCLEQLGQYAAALNAFEDALRLGAAEPGSDVFKASQERAADVERRVAKVALVLSPHAPADAEVRVDDATIAPPALKEPLVLDPGHHTFSGTATGAPPFHAALTLAEGSRVTITIALDPVNPRPTPDGHSRPATTRSTHVEGWITVAAGGGLLAGAGVLAILQRSAVDDIAARCPGGACPASQRDALSSERSRALLFEPLAVAFAAAGAVAAGVGIYFVLKPDVVVSPATTGDGAGLTLRGVF
jgi:hypothetical protein